MLVACIDCHRQYDVSGLSPGDPTRCHCGKLFRVKEQVPHEARAVHCSSCGGKLAAGSASCGYCGYCGNEITLIDRNLGVACPECFGGLPAGAKFCQGCGVGIRAERIQAMRVDADCPRCRGVMARCEFEAGHYTECTSCGGLWLEEEFFEWLVTTQDSACKPSDGNWSRWLAAPSKSSPVVRCSTPCASSSEVSSGRSPRAKSAPSPSPSPFFFSASLRGTFFRRRRALAG